MTPPLNNSDKLLREATEAHRRGHLSEAERAYRSILKHNPRSPVALHLLGLLCGQRGDSVKAIELLRAALSAKPDMAPAYTTLGDINGQLGNVAEAEQNYRQAIRYQPGLLEAQTGLAQLLLRTGRPGDAAAVFRNAIAQAPGNLELQLQLAHALRAAGRTVEWFAAAETATRLQPQHPMAFAQFAEACFASDRLPDAWRSLARAAELAGQAPGTALQQWRGENLENNGIFVWTHGGPGEEALFAHMIADVVAKAAVCIIQCSSRIAALYRRSFPTARVIDRPPLTVELAGVHYQSSAADLGVVLRASPGDMPIRAGYLIADPETRAQLRSRYLAIADTPRLLVGIAWQSLGVVDAGDKSVGLGDWGPLLNVPGVTFVNLQPGDHTAALDVVRDAFKAAIVEDGQISALGNLDLYAAQIAAMDIVVTASNSAAHLAGALGIPVLCLMPPRFAPGDRGYWLAPDERSVVPQPAYSAAGYHRNMVARVVRSRPTRA